MAEGDRSVLLEKQPPQNLEAEQSALGSMMLERSALEVGMGILVAEDFYRPAHQEVFLALIAQFHRDEPVDLITTQEELRKRGKLEDCGGTEYLMALVESVPTAAHVEHYARIVARKSEQRRVIAQLIEGIGVLNNEDIERPIDQIVTKLQNMRPAEVKPLSVWTLGEMLRRDVPPPEFIVEGMVPKAGITLITAQAKTGKSFLSLDMAIAVANGGKFLQQFETKQGPVLMLAAEGIEDNTIKRIQQVFLGRMESEDIPETAPVHLIKQDEDTSNFKVDTPSGKAALSKLMTQYKPALLILDPLVAIHNQDEKESGPMRNYVFMPLMQLAKMHECAIMVIHHPRKRGQITDENESIRGTSDILGAIDSHLHIQTLDGTRRQFKHAASRYGKEVESFVYEMFDGSEGQTYLRHVGPATENTEKEAQARETIIDIAKSAGGRVKMSEFIARCGQEEISRATVTRVVKSLIKEKNLKKDGHGWYVWWKSQAGLYEGEGEEE